MFSKQVYLDIELIVLWMIICSTSFPTIKHAASECLLYTCCMCGTLCWYDSPDDSMC